MDGKNPALESDYPYWSGGTGVKQVCNFSESIASAVSVQTFVQVEQNSASGMKAALEYKPLAVSIEADMDVFRTYSSGVLESISCGTKLDHAVLAVGYGKDEETGLDYWLIKNSWNTTWGDKGYVKFAVVDGEGTCGVQMEPLMAFTN